VLVDHRYYRVKPGTMNAHLDLYEKHGFLPQTRHLGQPLAYLYTESGEINIQAILTKVRELGYRGLVELEHLWSAPGLEIESRGIDWLRQVDATLV